MIVILKLYLTRGSTTLQQTIKQVTKTLQSDMSRNQKHKLTKIN